MVRRPVPDSLSLALAPALAAALTVSSMAKRTEAFCWSSTCKPDGVICEPPSPADCGLPLYWPRECVGYSMQKDGTSELSFEDASWAVAVGFEAWLQPFCNGEPPGIGLIRMQDVACDQVEYNDTAGNVNVVVFRDEAWTHPESPDKIAITQVTFNPDTGELYNVDIEVNSNQYPFTVTETTEHYDLVSIMTHEAGHFFGMGHSPESDATMFENYDPGSTEMSTLTADDQRGMCALYPPWPVDRATCNPIPRHGFASECRGDQPEHGCSTARVRPSGSGFAVWLAAAALGLWRRRRQEAGAKRRRVAAAK